MVEYPQTAGMRTLKRVVSNYYFKTTAVTAVLFVIIASIAYANPEIIPTQLRNTAIPSPTPTVSTPSPTIAPTNTPTQTPTAMPKKAYDPVVQCSLNECGIVEMLSSECRTAVCCPVGKSYAAMTTQAGCTKLQNDYASDTATKSQSTPSQQGLILQNAQNNANHMGSQMCLEQSEQESDRCFDSCMSSSNEGASACRYAADSLGWSTEKFSECLNENYAIYDKCGDDCLNAASQKRNGC